MYYMTRKELNKTTRKIYNSLFYKKLSKKDKILLKSKNDQKRGIKEIVVQSLGFNDLNDYTKKTTYLKDIKNMNSFDNLEYNIIVEIEKSILKSLIVIFPYIKKKEILGLSLFKHVFNHRLLLLKHPNNVNNYNWYNNFFNALFTLINKDQSEYGDFKSDDSFINFINNTISFSSKERMFDLDFFVEKMNIKYKYKYNFEILKKINNSFDLNPVKNDLLKMKNEELNIIKNELADFGRVDIYTLINKYTHNLYNKEFYNFIEEFKKSFFVKNKWIVNDENIAFFKIKFIEKYSKYDKI